MIKKRSCRWAGAALIVLMASACAGTSSGHSHASSGAGDTAGPRLQFSPANGATAVPLDAPVTVSTDAGQLTSVTVAPAAGPATPAPSTEPSPKTPEGPATLPGILSGRSWTSTAPLQPGAAYTVTATAKSSKGTRRLTSHFTTLTPTNTLTVAIAPLNGQTVGVGMPLALYLSSPVHDHAAFESHLSVSTSMPVQGGWHWFSDRELHFRPAQYWPTGEVVTLTANLAGFDDGNGVWSVTPRTVTFHIGASHISTVDAATHEMTVTSNGATVKTIPVSTGRDKYPTDSGVHVVSEKDPSTIMDSATVGIPRNSPDGYYETVYWDVRISNSGEFVHAAPWSVSDQGNANVSHGCVNVSTADGQWFYNFSQVGDVVQVQGTPTTLSPTNGFGDWQIPWAQWSD